MTLIWFQKRKRSFFVKPVDAESTYSIKNAYENLVYSNGFYEYLSVECGLDVSAVRDVVQLHDLGGRAEGNVSDGVFRLTVTYYEQKGCSELMQAVIDYIEGWKEEIQEKFGEHDVVILDQSMVVGIDTGILYQQRSYLNNVIANMTTASRLKDSFTDEEKQYYDYLIGRQTAENTGDDGMEEKIENIIPDADTQTSLATVVSPFAIIKYCILGMVLAVLAYVFIIFLHYIFDNKIKGVDDLEKQYDLPQMGYIPKEKASKPLGFVDEWLYSLRDRNKRKFSVEEAIKLSAVAIKIAAKKNGLESISLVGCDIKARTRTACEKMKEILEKEGIQADILNNVLYDAEAMERLGSVQGVVLVETAGSTLYEEVSKEIALLQRQNIPVLGGIVQE